VNNISTATLHLIEQTFLHTFDILTTFYKDTLLALYNVSIISTPSSYTTEWLTLSVQW